MSSEDPAAEEGAHGDPAVGRARRRRGRGRGIRGRDADRAGRRAEPEPESASDRLEAALERARDAIRERAGTGLPGDGGTTGPTSTTPLFPPLLDGLFNRSGVEESVEESPPPSTDGPSGEPELPAP